MAHEYSVQIHEWIKEKIGFIQKEIKASKTLGDSEKEGYYNGQLQQLLVMRQYMTDSIDLDTQTYYK